MAHFFNEINHVFPQTASKNAAIFTCLYDLNNYQPGAIIHCDTAASDLTGLSRQKILTCTIVDFCPDFPLLNSGDFDKVIHFRSEMKTVTGPPVLCDFSVTALFSVETILLNITAQPVSLDLSQSSMSNDIFPSNKLVTLDVLSHGISHGINNSINLITLSSDLLREILDDILSRFDPETISTIRGMSITELSKMLQELMNNIYNSSSKINTTSQALVHYLRINETTSVTSYDIRKILHSAVILTEHEICKSSNEFIFEPPQGIIKRTGNQQEILQAIFNCILFLCRYSENKKGSFRISTVIRPTQNNFCILMRHEGCVLSEDDLKIIALNNSAFSQLSVARELIGANSGEFKISQIRSGGTEITLTFTTVRSFY